MEDGILVNDSEDCHTTSTTSNFKLNRIEYMIYSVECDCFQINKVR